MKETGTLSRRRFVQIVAMTGVAGLAAKLGLDSTPDVIVTDSRILMGTIVNLTVLGETHWAAAVAAKACLDQMQRLETLLSRFRPDSQLSILNRDGHLSAADPALLELLDLSKQISEWSSGGFDITVKPLVDLYRQAVARENALPDDEELAQALELISFRQVHVNGCGVELARPGMSVTLDSIAKGYIVDRGIAVLRDLGFTNVIVEAGGDLLASGERRPGDAWRIGIKSPRESQTGLLASVAVVDQAVATSGDYMQAFSADLRHHHIVDPRTGRSPGELASATVRAPSAVLADALATALMVVGGEGVARLTDLAGCEAYLVKKDMTIVESANFRT